MRHKKPRSGVISDLPCNSCGRSGVLHYPCGASPDGVSDYCCDCSIAKSMASRRRDPATYERYKAKQRDWYYDNKVRTILGERA